MHRSDSDKSDNTEETDSPDHEDAAREGVTGRKDLLEDITVLDLSRVLSGPYAAMLLGDLGARVIKVERPLVGDDTRSWGPPFAGEDGMQESTYFLSVNRNKESISLDLKDEHDRAALHRLVLRSDVLIENFRPGVMQRLGLEHQRLLELNPKLVILSITGFGHDGPDHERVGYDQIVQGEAGIMSMTGRSPEDFVKVGIPVSDILAGVFGACGVLAALHRRTQTGVGQVVHTSLLAATVAVHAFQGSRWLIAGEVPQPEENRHPTLVPYEAFQCSDGVLQIAVGSEPIWQRFAPLVGLDGDDPAYRSNAARVRNRDSLVPSIAECLKERTAGEWLETFHAHGIPAGEVKTLDRVYGDEQVKSQGLILEVDHPTLGDIALPGPALRFSDGVGKAHSSPPTLGEHSDAVMSWLNAEL